MLRACLVGGLLLLLVSAPAAAHGSAEVAALQVALKARGLYSGPVDGIAGPGTRAGVRAIQARARIAVDGVAGPMTRSVLGRLGGPPFGSRTLRAPMAGWDAAVLQYLLAGRGFPSGPFDGAYGARTAAAVMRFQAARRLIADGIAGPATQAAVRAPAPGLPFALRRPVSAPRGDGFGPRAGRMHTGVDFPAPSGTTVYAAAAGCVKYAGDAGDGFGTVVSLGHGAGVTTLYAHLSRALVGRGGCVGAGAPIGLVGSTGHSTGPHLHFEARVNGAAVDPRV